MFITLYNYLIFYAYLCHSKTIEKQIIMIEPRPLILVTNDDSIAAPGLLRLVDCLPQDADIVVVAPAEQHSGQSSAITVGRPLFIRSHDDYRGARMFSIGGTPVDCVKLAMSAIVPRRPSLVLAGINHGSNSGCNVIYSGTMGAVLEGCTYGITSCGFSILNHSLDADFSATMPYIKEIVADILAEPLPAGICLNVNMPAREAPRGVRACRAARGHWTDEYDRYTDPMGNPFFWLTGRFVNEEPEAADTDEYWLSHNYISVVPVSGDMTAMSYISATSKRFDR